MKLLLAGRIAAKGIIVCGEDFIDWFLGPLGHDVGDVECIDALDHVLEFEGAGA
jgi:hypothetical protein